MRTGAQYKTFDVPNPASQHQRKGRDKGKDKLRSSQKHSYVAKANSYKLEHLAWRLLTFVSGASNARQSH
jgi:hypothetical protein